MSGKWKRKALLTAGIIILVLGLLIQGTARKNGKEKRKPLRRFIGELRDAQQGYRRHFILPDVQAKDGVPLDHRKWAGEYIAEKRPDVVICIRGGCQ